MGLEALNFAVVGAREGFGPFPGVYLQGEGFDPAATGVAMSLAGIAGVVATTPLSALVDRTTSKRAGAPRRAGLPAAARRRGAGRRQPRRRRRLRGDRLAGRRLALHGNVALGAASAALTLAAGTLYAGLGLNACWAVAGLCALALPLARGLGPRIPAL